MRSREDQTMPRTVSTASRPPAPAPEEARWEAVLARDTAFDGDFYYSVATTGVYCRPSCPARRPKRAHVGFHDTAASAEAAGFRPCKRCKPDQPSALARHEAKVVQACRLIEAAEAPPSLQALADAAGLSPSHFHRLSRGPPASRHEPMPVHIATRECAQASAKARRSRKRSTMPVSIPMGASMQRPPTFSA